MAPQRKKLKVWPFLLLGGMAVLLFAIQPLLSSGGSGMAATPTPTVEPTATPEGTPVPGGTPAAATTPMATPTATGPQGFSSGDILGLVARLAVVVVIIFVSLYLLRIWTNRTKGGNATGNVVRVLDTIALGNNRQMYLVDAGDKVLVVGATQQSLNLLSELTNPETLSAIRAPKGAAGNAAAASMSELVRRAGAHFALPKPAATEPASGVASASMKETLQQMLRGGAEPQAAGDGTDGGA